MRIVLDTNVPAGAELKEMSLAAVAVRREVMQGVILNSVSTELSGGRQLIVLGREGGRGSGGGPSETASRNLEINQSASAIIPPAG
jgi:hypothetical protein